MRGFAIEFKYRLIGEEKWKKHTTKWYDSISLAWEEKERWEKTIPNISESCSSAIHKDVEE